ncbi:MAG: aldehyde dehydrogenase family protein [Candidatus Lokiarchaeota archaeon]|nr:aldehyde dehydrogenase family protein [Candidatus Lokiarchaeota archaeon]
MKIELTHEIFQDIYQIGEDGIPEFKNFIGGKWLFCEKFMEIHSPIDGALIARVTIPTSKTINIAIDSAYQDGRKNIRNYPGQKRIKTFLSAVKIMEESKQDFIDVLVKSAGKPLENATGEVNATIERLDKTTMESTRLMGEYIPGDWSEETYETQGFVKREPFGLILTIGPFNYPLFIPATKIIPSILVGNAVFLKPASAAPIAPLMLTRILEQSGLPVGSLTVLTIRGKETNVLVQNRKFCAISFTGSTAVGETIIKQGGIKNYHMELGGKDPAIVLNDCNIERTVDKLFNGIVKYAGQRCDAIKLIFVESGIYSELKTNLLKKLENVKAENPLIHKEAIMGPLIDMKSTDKIEEAYKDALQKGANLLTKFNRHDNYIDPLLMEVTTDMLPQLIAFQDEIFGPLSLIIKIETPTEGLKLSNLSRFGLDASIFSENESKIQKIARSLEVGAVFVNEYPRHGIGYYPFGGVKDSGIGREGIGYSAYQLTTTKTIVHNFKGSGVWEYL